MSDVHAFGGSLEVDICGVSGVELNFDVQFVASSELLAQEISAHSSSTGEHSSLATDSGGIPASGCTVTAEAEEGKGDVGRTMMGIHLATRWEDDDA